MHTTASAPIDVPAVFAPVAPLARTTVRLHPRPGSPTVQQSSLGGPLLWPAGEAWPVCDGSKGNDHLQGWPGEAEVPLVPVLQLLADDVPELPFPTGTDVLQVLWCPFDHEPWSSPRPEIRWRRRAEIGTLRPEMPLPDSEADPEHVPSPCLLDPERVVEYPTYDLPKGVWAQIRDTVRQVEQDTGWQYAADLAVASGTKVGGYPGWMQPPDWPVCGCGTTMQHMLTVASWEFSRGDEKRWIPVEDRPAMAGWDFSSPGDHPWRTIQNPAGLMLGDAGGVYLFACASCPDRPMDYRFDCS
jgi:hypothetical protein